MPHRLSISLGMLATAAALLAAGQAAGLSARPGGTAVGVSKKSFCLAYVAFNNSRPLFRGNAPLRRAVNWAIDRTDYVAGSDTQTPWTHLLPPDAPGSVKKARLQPYGVRANLAKAREIAAGHFRDGRMTIYYSSSGATGSSRAENIRRDLINLGFDPASLTMRGFAGFQFYDAIGKRNGEWDLAVSVAACSEDPAAFMLPAWYFPRSPKYRHRIKAAMRLTGRARSTALGRLDLEVMRNLAPVAVMAVGSGR